MRSWILLLAFGLITTLAHAQPSDETLARHWYAEAMTAVDDGDHARVVQLLRQTREVLGGTRQRFQTPLIRSLLALDDWAGAGAELDNYFSLMPDTSLAEYAEMVASRELVEERMQVEREDYERARNEQRIDLYERYLHHYPYGRYRAEAWTALEELCFVQARQENTVEGYEAYIKRFPDSPHIAEARQALEGRFYRRMQRRGTVAAYNAYLVRYPDGRFAEEAYAAIRDRDVAAFKRAQEIGSVAAYQGYAEQFPGGAFRDEALQQAGSISQSITQTYRDDQRIAHERTIKRYNRAARRSQMGGIVAVAFAGVGAYGTYYLQSQYDPLGLSETPVTPSSSLSLGVVEDKPGLFMGAMAVVTTGALYSGFRKFKEARTLRSQARAERRKLEGLAVTPIVDPTTRTYGVRLAVR